MSELTPFQQHLLDVKNLNNTREEERAALQAKRLEEFPIRRVEVWRETAIARANRVTRPQKKVAYFEPSFPPSEQTIVQASETSPLSVAPSSSPLHEPRHR